MHHPPQLQTKKKLFYLLACHGALSCHDVGVFSLYPSWHVPNGSSFNLASFGWSFILAGRTSLPLSPPPNYTPLPLTHDPTTSHIGWVQAGGAWASRVFSLHVCPRSACRLCVCRDKEACLHGLLLFFVLLCGLFYNSLLTLGAGLPLILCLKFLPAH